MVQSLLIDMIKINGLIYKLGYKKPKGGKPFCHIF